MTRDEITIPRPVVPHGPAGMTEDAGTAHYLREVLRKIDTGYTNVGGSNVTAAVRSILIDCARALEGRAAAPADTEYRVDPDRNYVYWRDPIEGCWVSFKRADCVGEEELPVPGRGRRERPMTEQMESLVTITYIKDGKTYLLSMPSEHAEWAEEMLSLDRAKVQAEAKAEALEEAADERVRLHGLPNTHAEWLRARAETHRQNGESNE